MSILFHASDPPRPDSVEPPYFHDLNLDQVTAAIANGREEHDLAPLFHQRLSTVEAIAYRQEVIRELGDEALRTAVSAFADAMRDVRAHHGRAARSHDRYVQEAWLLEAANAYCDAVCRLVADLGPLGLRSDGWLAFREWLAAYAASEPFTTMVADAISVKHALEEAHYTIAIRGDQVTVARYEDEDDYSTQVLRTFEKFKQGDVKDHRVRFRVSPDLNHVEARILALVARLHPDTFAALDDFGERYRDPVAPTVAAFDREVQFCLAYLQHTERIARDGLRFCLPRVSPSKAVRARRTFDVALAGKLAGQEATVVPNDFELASPERILVVSGPNQGGKTTFARTFGQLHHLGMLGLPVPGDEARLHLCDEIFTHFEREEAVTSLAGKLEDDLQRVHGILERATGDSIVVMNESFSSTTLADALVLGRAVLGQMLQRDLLGVYVTFVDELASLSEATVSMTSTVVPDDPVTRTFEIVRRPADGLAYAAAIAERYGLTYGRLKERLTA